MHRIWDSLTRDDVFKMSKSNVVRLLEWNDPNGNYRDDPGDDYYPTLTELRETLWEQVRDSRS